jgi:hypothetical protein
MEEKYLGIESRLVAVEDVNWQLTARLNAIQMICASLFAEALVHRPKDKRVEAAQGMFHALTADARRTTLYDETTPEGRRLAKATPREMDHIIGLLIDHLSRMAA